ncbi:MAG: tetratricopeptide repeat protein [Planctomycetales bacterium]|nr:tetratricopeptide repeat protein [Planctomycetales bacterium]
MNTQTHESQPLGPAPLSVSARQRLQRCYQRGKELTSQSPPDFDYAHTMFTECVLNDPSNLEYVDALLTNLQKKYKNNKKGATFRGFGGKSSFKKAVAAEEWDDVFRMGFELLKSNPWDVLVLHGIAEACQANHFNEVELRYLKNALDAKPKDVDVNKHCAESLARMGQFDQAIACWNRILEQDKNHPDAQRRIGELTMAKTMGKPLPALPGARVFSNVRHVVATASESTAATADDEVPTPRRVEPAPEPVVVTRESLEAAIQKEPNDPDHYLRLAEWLDEQAEYRDAFQAYRKALQVAGGNSLLIREKVEEAQIRMYQGQLAIAEQRSNAEKTAEARDLAARFRSELNRQEMQFYAIRSERYPEEIQLQYELAVRLKRDEKFLEAAKAFEKAAAANEFRAISMLELGECYQHLRRYGNAMKSYRSVLELPNLDEDVEKRVLYRAAILGAALKDVESAIRMLERLVNLDKHYRDATTRLDKLKQISNKD